MMLQKSKSQGVALIKYCLSAPLFVLMLILSSATISNSRTVRLFNNKAEQVFLIPAVIDTAGTANDTIPKTKVKVINIRIADPQSVKDTGPTKDTRIFTSVEQVPEFPGGIQAFGTYLSKNIKYPAEARKNKVQGRVIISFVVEKDGSLTNVYIARGVEDDIDQEALRVIKLSPKWKPGIQNGKFVRVAYSVPIAFTLDDSNPGKPGENKTGAVYEHKDTTNAATALNVHNVFMVDPGKKNTWVITKDGVSPGVLYVLDGKEISNLNAVNPNDIESVSILKDKSATAIYGLRGANGVVIITSKKKVFKFTPLKLEKN